MMTDCLLMKEYYKDYKKYIFTLCKIWTTNCTPRVKNLNYHPPKCISFGVYSINFWSDIYFDSIPCHSPQTKKCFMYIKEPIYLFYDNQRSTSRILLRLYFPYYTNMWWRGITDNTNGSLDGHLIYVSILRTLRILSKLTMTPTSHWFFTGLLF